MTQEDKELLVKDLCSRLPYGVKCQYNCVIQEGTLVIGKANCIGELKGIVPQRNGHIGFMVDCDKIDALEGDIKPYLRPMSSMTDEERKDWYQYSKVDYDCEFKPEPTLSLEHCHLSVDWLNKKGFDYRGLIPMGLALEEKK